MKSRKAHECAGGGCAAHAHCKWQARPTSATFARPPLSTRMLLLLMFLGENKGFVEGIAGSFCCLYRSRP